MPSDSTIAIVVSGVLGVAGIAVPAVTTFLTKRGDRAHDLALKRHEQAEARRARLVEERERLYLDILRSIREVRGAVNTALAKGADPGDALHALPVSEEEWHIFARSDAYATDAVRDLNQEWIDALSGLIDPEPGPAPQSIATVRDVQNRLMTQLRREMQGEQ